jgi:nicotinate-nucleotide pyrophosphorylase (carboxylating)
MQSIELGPGDLTTESVSPYALHSAGSLRACSEGIFSGRGVLDVLFENSGEQLTIDWKIAEGEKFQSGDILFDFKGNGAEIIKNRRLIQWIVGRMSGVATATRKAANLISFHNRQLVQGISVNPIFEVLDSEAFKIGGGSWIRQGLTDTIYITQLHAAYAGGVEKALEKVNRDLGDARRTIKIELEVNTAAQFKAVQEMDYDALHLVGLPPDQIQQVFEELNPVKKPVLHLPHLRDFQECYTDYFFKYCAIEDLHTQIEFLKNELTLESLE